MRHVALPSCLAVLVLAACGRAGAAAGDGTAQPEPVLVTATGVQRTEDQMVTMTITKHREGAPDEVVTTTAPASETASIEAAASTTAPATTTTPSTTTTAPPTTSTESPATTASATSTTTSETSAALIGPGYAASNGFAAGTPASLGAADPLVGSVVLPAPGAAAFVSPSGNLACSLDGSSVQCQVRMHDFAVPASDTEAAGCDTNIRADAARARFVCGDGDLGAEASLSGGKVGWWQSTLGSQDRGSAGDTYQAAVLPYGHALTVGGTRCRLDYEGVSCWAGSHAFFLRKQAYLLR